MAIAPVERAVHPAAALFPMLTEEELADLAADIAANGQVHPIVLDADGQLIDGRNRLAACQLAGVEPQYTTLPEGTDPVAFILSTNVARRHLTTGQAAMAVVRARLFVTNNRQVDLAAEAGVKRPRIAKAAVVLDYAPDLADAVIRGAQSLDDAYKVAQDSKGAASSLEAQRARLEAEAPDFLALVVEERITLREALAALEQRQRERRQQQEITTRLLSQALLFLNAGDMAPEARAARIAEAFDSQLVPAGCDASPAGLARAVATLRALCIQLAKGE